MTLKKSARANAVPRKIFALIMLTRFLRGFDDLDLEYAGIAGW
jgi:hypothetical protein